MKKIIQLIALLLAAIFLLTACNTPSNEPNDTTADTTLADDTTTLADDTTTGAPEDPAEPEEEESVGGTVVNVDGDALYYLLKHYNWSLNNLEQNAITWFDSHYANCGVTDMFYSISMSAPFASDDPDLYDKLDKYNTKEENGIAVDYTQNENISVSYRIYTETDVDPYQVWFDRCRELGINPWLSFRMNDVHYANEDTGLSPFQYKAKANGWVIGNDRYPYWLSNGSTAGSRYWYEYALDYSVPQVRERFLKEIEDRLSTYDCYGIELDWQRQIWCFTKDDVENCKYMNEFLEDVNEIVEKYEAIYGHDIKISARINRDIDENMYFGFDVRYWAQNDRIDVVIPSCYYGVSDSDMPIAEWVEELKDYKVEVWAGLECDATLATRQSSATLAGYATQYYGQGAKKIYLFNLFGWSGSDFTPCSSPEAALAAASRSYVVTEANCTPFNVKGIEQWDPLPVHLQVNYTFNDIDIKHGLLDYEKDTYIFIGVTAIEEGDVADYLVTITYNGVECEFVGASLESHMKDKTNYGTIIAYKVPAEAVNGSLKGELVFDPGVNFTLNYVELMNGNLS